MKTSITCLVVLLMAAVPTHAQWEYGGKVVGQYIYGYTDNLAAASVGDGSIVVAWNGLDNGSYAIFAQRLDSAGYAMWPEGGLVVCGGTGSRQHYAAVLPDGEGGAFVVWSDWRHTWAQGVALYGQHLGSLGNKLWVEDGDRLTADTFSHGDAQLYPDGYGGFVAVYEASHFRYDIGAQRVAADGRVLWDSTGIFLTRAPDDQGLPKTCRVADSTFVTVWLDDRFGIDPDSSFYGSDIYMQRFNLEGNVLWDPGGIPAVHWRDDQGYLQDGHDIAPDGHGGCVVVWRDSRIEPPGHGALYANRFSPNGQQLWVNQGKDLGNGHPYNAYECQAFRIDSSDSFMFRWEAGGNPEYFRFSHVDLSGNFIGSEVFALDTFYVDKAIMDPQGIFKYQTHYQDSLISGLVGRKCDMGGHQYWPNHPFITNDRLRGTETLLGDGFAGMIDAWKQSSASNIRITRIYADGHVGGDTTTGIYDEPPNLPTGIAILGNYPNPFNASTTISYSLSEEAFVRLEIYNSLGQLVKTLLSGNQSAGRHTVGWNADEGQEQALGSAPYFYRLKTGNTSVTRKMLILK